MSSKETRELTDQQRAQSEKEAFHRDCLEAIDLLMKMTTEQRELAIARLRTVISSDKKRLS